MEYLHRSIVVSHAQMIGKISSPSDLYASNPLEISRIEYLLQFHVLLHVSLRYHVCIHEIFNGPILPTEFCLSRYCYGSPSGEENASRSIKFQFYDFSIEMGH
jgi:hypothetical protein